MRQFSQLYFMRILILVILLPVQLYAGTHIFDTAGLRPPFSIYLMPTQLLNPVYSSGFTLGAEFRVYRRISLTLEGGPFYTPGYMAKGNIKYYLKGGYEAHNLAITHFYFAIEYVYKKQSYKVKDKLRDPPETEFDYTVYKYVNTVNIKFGKTVSFPHSAFIDSYFGIGVRYRTVHNSLLPGEDEKLYHLNESQIDNFTNSEAKGYLPCILLGIKIGYRYK